MRWIFPVYLNINDATHEMAAGKILQSLNKHSSITTAPTREGRDVFALRAFWFVKLNISTVIKNSLDCHDVEKYLPPLRWRGKAEGGRAVPPSSPPPPSFSISGNWQIIHSLQWPPAHIGWSGLQCAGNWKSNQLSSWNVKLISSIFLDSSNSKYGLKFWSVSVSLRWNMRFSKVNLD